MAMTVDEATAVLTAPGQMFEIERAVVVGREMSVWRHAPRTLRDVLDLSLRHAERDFLVYEGERVTFDQHYRRAATLSRRLHADGVRPGDRVAVAARNLPTWVIAFWGAISAGAIAVLLNAWWSADELEYGLMDSSTSVLFVDDERLTRIAALLDRLPALRTVVVLPSAAAPAERPSHPRVRIIDYADFLGDVAADATPVDVAISPDDDATMFYTSGTTGHPKGAVGTHRNATTNLMNLFFISQRSALRFPPSEEERRRESPNASLLNVPLFHATGCLAVMVVNTAAGGKIVMMHHFDAGDALRLIERERITLIGGVPTIAMQILDHPAFTTTDTSSVRSVSYGGAPAPPDLVRRIREGFDLAQPGNGYGLTETSAAIALNSGPDYVERPTSCGPVVPVCEAAIVPEGWDEPDPPVERLSGEELGELWVRGPSVVRGYWNKPEETARAFTDGWLHTGDIARMDPDGFIHIVDRAKDMIIRGGENVYSVGVEAALFEHPDVADCAVVGLPHPVWGEEVAAVIVPRPGRRIDPEELRSFLRPLLAHFEVPTRIFLRDEPLPRNPQGKVLKRQLRSDVSGE